MFVELELRVAKNISEIPNDIRDITDLAKKRKSPKKREKERRKGALGK